MRAAPGACRPGIEVIRSIAPSFTIVQGIKFGALILLVLAGLAFAGACTATAR
jgi:hypothetical protein